MDKTASACKIQVLLFWCFLELKNIYFFNLQLIESIDVEHADMEG